MKSFEIHLEDIHRILFGAVPLSFFFEVIIRTAIIYIIIVIAMRLMGKRMSMQLTRNEMAAMVSLAAAIGVPIQAPDRGLLPIVIIAVVILTFQGFIAKRSASNENFERHTLGDVSTLIKDAVMDLSELKKSRLTRYRLFAQLRAEGITQLGMVQRLYLEANGTFSLKKMPDPQPGLSIIPDWDKEFNEHMHTETEKMACTNCGFVNHTVNTKNNAPCPSCHANIWAPAVK